jgi:hypothetical protein
METDTKKVVYSSSEFTESENEELARQIHQSVVNGKKKKVKSQPWKKSEETRALEKEEKDGDTGTGGG